ncbi:uncharacterized protein LOC112694651 [Sipha flava]|jgi:hypothetical protein|uniref:Uncharacterized protein LOC112694651 n=1 Tax=Sipha flava TaxID=143950 RepID=A0A2S2R708_9HEMI|nr:uncharacterized protein LOC112694651 [Sipha flava]
MVTWTADSAEAVAAVNMLRDNVHLAGTVYRGTWYYPPTVLDENGRLWGSYTDHLDRVLKNRMLLRYCYRSLQPDAPVPVLLDRTGHVAMVEAFTADLMTYYRPLLTVVDALRTDLGAQTVCLVAEANILYNIASAMSHLLRLSRVRAFATEL